MAGDRGFAGAVGLRAGGGHRRSLAHVCNDYGYQLNEQAKTAARLSDITIGAGLIGAGMAVYLYLTSRAESPIAPPTTAGRIKIRADVRAGAAALIVGVSF